MHETGWLITFALLLCVSCGGFCLCRSKPSDTSSLQEPLLPPAKQDAPATTPRSRSEVRRVRQVTRRMPESIRSGEVLIKVSGSQTRSAHIRDATDGFNPCVFCGFENFKRHAFCGLCGSQLPKLEVTSAENTKSTKGTAGAHASSTSLAPLSVNTELSPSATMREKRARRRKYWTRKMDVDGLLYWYRSSPVKGLRVRDSFGYAMKFLRDPMGLLEEELAALRVSSASVLIGANNEGTRTEWRIEIVELPPEEESNSAVETGTARSGDRQSQQTRARPLDEVANPPVVYSKIAVAQRLSLEVSFQTLVLTEASEADPADSPVTTSDAHGTTKDAGATKWKNIFEAATHDFPTKYSRFLSTTAPSLIDASRQYVKLNIRRDHLLEDSMEALSVLPQSSIYAAMRVEFVREPGVDGGALQREWFTLLTQALTEPANGVFKCMSMAEQIFYLNPHSASDIGDGHLMYYFAVGRLVGRSLIESQALHFHLALPLLKIILGQPLTFNDLEFFDPEAFKSLVWIQDNDGVDDLGLTFSITEQRHDGKVVEVDLIEDGRNIDVTDENKELYVERRFRYVLFESVSSQLYAFLKGLYEIVPHQLLTIFDPEELDYVLCGSDEIDVDDWERNTRVSATMQAHPDVVKWFWEFVREMPNEYRRRLLHFATGTSRVPLGGFAALTSTDGRLCPFTLKGVEVEKCEYIASHACFNQLDMPFYTSRGRMEVVLYGILETELHGFTID